jgi:hypothetical protein
MAETEFIEQLRRDLPTLLREHPEVRHELWGMMLEAFPSREEFRALLEEMRAMREDTNRRFEELRQDMNRRFEAVDRRFEAIDRRFEAIDRRFEAVDRRFEAVIGELRDHSRQLRDLNIHLSALGGRVGYGLEDMVKAVVEEFAGHTFPVAERLLLRDETGEVFGVAGAEVEFDLYVHNGEAYLVEVKSHLKPSDVLSFHQKVQFARQKLGREVIPFILALSMDTKAEESMRRLGIRYRVRATVSR